MFGECSNTSSLAESASPPGETRSDASGEVALSAGTSAALFPSRLHILSVKPSKCQHSYAAMKVTAALFGRRSVWKGEFMIVEWNS